MAGLFDMPTPEAIRLAARRDAMDQARLFAQAPPGRGFVQAASQAGGLFGEAIGRGLGGKLPGEEKAMKFQAIQQKVAQDLQGQNIDVSTPDGFIQMAQLTADYANQAGLPEIAQKAGAQALEIRKQFEPKVTEQYAPIYNDAGRVVAQREINTNKVISDPRAPKDPDTEINNYLGDQDQLAKSLSKAFGEDIVKRRNDALDAKNSLMSANNAVDLLNSGVVTGTGANFIVGVGKALQRVGFDVGKDAVANTEAFYANQAKQVAQIIKAFGAGTGLSDADREYAEKAAAGKITMSEQSIRKIIDLNARASRNALTQFNEDVAKIPEKSKPIDLSIEIPEFRGTIAPKTDMTDEEYERRKKELGL